MLQFRILGPLEVLSGTDQVRLGGRKQRATLAILLLNANRVVSVDRLAEDLYSGAPPVTAVTQVQRQISDLRKTLASESLIQTRAPGYVLRLSDPQLDLHEFEAKTDEARRALAQADAEAGSRLLREALALWRGRPLADLADEPFAAHSIARLEEMRLAALEQRIDAELALGRHVELVGDLEELVADHPLRERFSAQLMLALYRSGRQAEALERYRMTRAALVSEFGIDPAPLLHELQRAILRQDPALELARPDSARAFEAGEADRTILVLPSDDRRLSPLLAIAAPLAEAPGRELIIARLVQDENEVTAVAAALHACRPLLPGRVRTAAFTTSDAPHDVARLTETYDVELVLMDAPARVDGDRVPDEVAATIASSRADVAILAGAPRDLTSGAGIFVPFGGSEHDWAALELGAWLSTAIGVPLALVGTKADPARRRRDASRLLADASLAVQRVVGVDAEPLLVEPAEESLVAAVRAATLVVAGISPRWRREGVGSIRRALLQAARPGTLLVHRGPRPGGLAPRESRTAFTWSLDRA